MQPSSTNREPGFHASRFSHDGFCLVEPPRNSPHLDSIRYRRSQAANRCLQSSAAELPGFFENEYLPVLDEIENCNLKLMPLEPDERVLVDALLENIGQNKSVVNKLSLYMLAMLYVEAFKLPDIPDPDQLPDWFRQAFWGYVTSKCFYFQTPGEVNKYTRHVMAITALLQSKITRHPTSFFWRRAGRVYLEKINLVALYFGRNNLAELHESCSGIARQVLRDLQFQLDHTFDRLATRDSKVRLGVYAQNIGNSTEMFASLPVFGYLDRQQFRVCLYTHGIADYFIEQKLEDLVEQIRLLPESINTSVRMIREDNLDILFFCNNITAATNTAHIMAQHRLARHQCVHFCQPLSTGVTNVDSFIIGRDIEKKIKSSETFSERLVSLEGSGICFDLPPIPGFVQNRISRAGLKLGKTQTVFISGANFFKIIPELRLTWAKILADVPGAALILYPFGPAWSRNYPKQQFVADLVNLFQHYGLSAKQLLVFDTLPDRSSILELLSVADIYLDSVPYSGATSLLDPLQAGLPLVSVDGPYLRFCQGAAMLEELGLGELAAASESEYRLKAVEMGQHPDLRIGLRHRINTAMSRGPAFLDAKGFGKKMSRVFFDMIRPVSSHTTCLPNTGTG